MRKEIAIRGLIAAFAVALGMSFYPGNAQAAKKKIKLNKTSVELYKGSSATLKLKNKNKTIKKNIKWKSSAKKIISVSSNGKITAKKAGKATITAKYKGKKYKCRVRAGNYVESLGLTLDKGTQILPDGQLLSSFTKEGDTHKLIAHVGGKKLLYDKVTYSSSDEAIAKVTTDGTITIGSWYGTAVITVTTLGLEKKTKSPVSKNVTINIPDPDPLTDPGKVSAPDINAAPLIVKTRINNAVSSEAIDTDASVENITATSSAVGKPLSYGIALLKKVKSDKNTVNALVVRDGKNTDGSDKYKTLYFIDRSTSVFNLNAFGIQKSVSLPYNGIINVSDVAGVFHQLRTAGTIYYNKDSAGKKNLRMMFYYGNMQLTKYVNDQPTTDPGNNIHLTFTGNEGAGTYEPDGYNSGYAVVVAEGDTLDRLSF
ncbi:MAG: Ig-like domain-containing protein [Lachnospiraceae bacterium]|nr:Ig-like domain-containing protein [Lachnospiraceae bacterium]MEE3461033.1 Ig-like domain-containing protein [Lachnospiraceae bacterium]